MKMNISTQFITFLTVLFSLLCCHFSTCSVLYYRNNRQSWKTSDNYDLYFGPSEDITNDNHNSSYINKLNREMSTNDNPGMDIDLSNTPTYDTNSRESYQTIETKINVASTEYAFVYFNGFLVGSVRDFTSFESFKIFAGIGDVISIIAMNLKGWHGIICDVEYDDEHHMTGMDGMFKVKSADQVDDKKGWKYKNFNKQSCKWDDPVTMPRPTEERFSKSFPYQSGIKYVWTPNAPPVSHIFLRFVIGGLNNGDDCKDNDDEKDNEIGVNECVCREISGSNGDCYEFDNPDHYNFLHVPKKCTRRDCAPSYECIDKGSKSSEQAGSTICIKRYATTVLKPVKPLTRGKCTQKKVHPPKAFYAPYGGV